MTKTYTIIFSRPSSSLSINHTIFSTSESTLCFTINSHLDYSPHINNMIRTANYFLYNIIFIITAITKCLIHSIIFSRIIYCCSLLCNLPVNLMYKLERIQCRNIRVLYKLNYASIVSISALMRSLGWLKFRYICIYRLLFIAHNSIHCGFSEYLAQSMTIQCSNRSNRKCHIMKLVQRSTSLAYSESAFSVIASKSWNSLTYEIRCVTSLSLFKRKLCVHFKSLLFVLYLFLFLFFII